MKRITFEKRKEHWRKTLLVGAILLVLMALPFRVVKVEQEKAEVVQQKESIESLRELEKEDLIKKIQNLDEEKENLKKKLEVKEKNPTLWLVMNKIKKYFPDNPKTNENETVMATAIFKNESGLQPVKTGYNCWYSKDGQVKTSKTEDTDRSKGCNLVDRHMAWSVDCGLAQINMVGLKQCPEYTFDIDWNLGKAQGKYKVGGWYRWVAYTDEKHLKDLDWAKQTLIAYAKGGE